MTRQERSVRRTVTSEHDSRLMRLLSGPGHFHRQVIVHIHTPYAQRLITGRPGSRDKRGFIGLFGFAECATQIWKGAAHGELYAHWWLIKLEEALAGSDSRLADSLTSIRQHLVGLEGLTIEPPTSTASLPIVRKFSTPYGYRAAQLVGLYDRLIREMLIARKVARTTSDVVSHAICIAEHEIRRTFYVALGYAALGSIRDDVLEASPAALQATTRMERASPGNIRGPVASSRQAVALES